MGGPTIERCGRALPFEVASLAAEAEAEGMSFVTRLVREWDEGTKRFDRPGELFLLAHDGEDLVGVGGLNVDPFLDDPSVGRVRHLYVHPSHRGRGIGQALAREIIAAARQSFRTLRVRSFEAGAFYEALGFEPTDEPNATHRLAPG